MAAGPVRAHLAILTTEPAGRALRPRPQLAGEVIATGVGAFLGARGGGGGLRQGGLGPRAYLLPSAQGSHQKDAAASKGQSPMTCVVSLQAGRGGEERAGPLEPTKGLWRLGAG